MDISVAENSRAHFRCSQCHGVTHHRAETCEHCIEHVQQDNAQSIGSAFNQNFLYILATASSVVAAINYVFSYYSIW